jgi:hypothetical protein
MPEGRFSVKLNVDHCFDYPRWDVHREFYRVAFQRLGDPCSA